MRKKSIVILILSIFGVVILGVAIWLLVSNWSAIEAGIKGQKLFTEDQVEAIARDNYINGESLGLKYKQELDSCILEVEALKSKNDVQANEILDLTSRVGILKGQIESLQNANALKEAEVVELNAKIEELKAQLLGVFSDKFNAGFNEGVNSVDVNGLYEQAYNEGYDAGYRRQEKVYTEQQANINVVWDGSIDTIWYTSDMDSTDSTYDYITDSYLIYKPSQLAGMSKLSEEGEDFAGKNFAIINDLYFNDSNVDVYNYDILSEEQKLSVNKFIPIANFSGNFYGNGHTITGLCAVDLEHDYVGMFGQVCNSEINKIRIENSYFSGVKYVGSLAGSCKSDNGNLSLLVKNVEIQAKVQNGLYVGGLFGFMYNLSCENIYATTRVSGYHYVGGLVGYLGSARLDNVYVNSEVIAVDSNIVVPDSFIYRSIGGLAGLSYCSDLGYNININTKILSPSNIDDSFKAFRFYGGVYGWSISNVNFDSINISESDYIKVFADLPIIDNEYFILSCVGVFDVDSVVKFGGRDIPIIYNSSSLDVAGYVIFDISTGKFYFDTCYYDMQIVKDESILPYIGEVPYILEVGDIDFTVLGTELTITKVKTNKVYYRIPNNFTIDETVYEVVALGDGTNCVDSDVESIILPEGLKVIKQNSFVGCTGLTSIKIPSTVTGINTWAFRNCSNLKSISLSEGLKTISGGAFENCTSLTTITIPSTVTSVGEYAFNGCSNLATITIETTTPPTFGNNVFYNCSKLSSIIVPAGTKSAYVTALGETYENIIVEKD